MSSEPSLAKLSDDRWPFAFTRWLGLSVAFSAGLLAFFVALAVGHEVIGRVPLPDGLGPRMILGGAAVVVAATFRLAWGLLSPSRGVLSEWRRYPPLALAVAGALLAGLSLLSVGLVDVGVGFLDARMWSLLLASSLLGVSSYYWDQKSALRSGKQASPSNVSPDCIESVLEWAEIERPADVSDPDLFGGKDLAARMTAVLAEERGREKAVALVGPFGSGKSSVLGWTEGFLIERSPHRIWVVRVSCWGLEDPKGAPRYILDRMLDALSERIDTHALTGLPDAYERLMGGIGVGFLGSAGLRPDWPEVIQRLETILGGLSVRLMIFIEDADRHEGGSVQPISRLLHELRGASNITFVLAVDDTRGGIDLSKACDHIFRIPPIDREFVRRALRAVRQHCLGCPFIDPLGDARQSVLEVNAPRGRMEEYLRLRYGAGVSDALADLMPTPRKVKHVIRSIRRAWGALAGEIDPDDLIVLATLRECEPVAYEFLTANLLAVRLRPDGDGLPSHHPERANVKKAWEDLLGAHPRAKAISRVVGFLRLEGLGVPEGQRRPQGVGQTEAGADYFQRFRDEAVAPFEVRDQVVLALIDKYKSGDQGPLLQELVKSTVHLEGFIVPWEHLSDRHPPDELLVIAANLLERLRVLDGGASSRGHEGLLALWRRASKRVQRESQGDPWLQTEALKAVGLSLDQVNCLYYYWASVRYGIVSASGREATRRAIVEAARQAFVDSGHLGRLLVGAAPHALSEMRKPSDENGDPATVLTDLTEWAWIVPPLIRLLRDGHPKVPRQIAHLIGRWKALDELSTVELDIPSASALAGANTGALLRTIVAADGFREYPRLCSQAAEQLEVYPAPGE